MLATILNSFEPLFISLFMSYKKTACLLTAVMTIFLCGCDEDTGSIGIFPDESGYAFVERLLQYKNLEFEGIFTHFARADEADKSHAMQQLRFLSG